MKNLTSLRFAVSAYLILGVAIPVCAQTDISGEWAYPANLCPLSCGAEFADL